MSKYKWIGRRAEEIRGGGKRVHRMGWIADVLEELGLTRRPAPNRMYPRRAPCPPDWRPAIKQASAEWTAWQEGAQWTAWQEGAQK